MGKAVLIILVCRKSLDPSLTAPGKEYVQMILPEPLVSWAKTVENSDLNGLCLRQVYMLPCHMKTPN